MEIWVAGLFGQVGALVEGHGQALKGSKSTENCLERKSKSARCVCTVLTCTTYMGTVRRKRKSGFFSLSKCFWKRGRGIKQKKKFILMRFTFDSK